MSQKIDTKEKKKYFEKCSECGRKVEVKFPSRLTGYAAIMSRILCKKCKEELNENKTVFCKYCGEITVVNDYGLGYKIRQCNTYGCRLNNDYFSHRPSH